MHAALLFWRREAPEPTAEKYLPPTTCPYHRFRYIGLTTPISVFCGRRGKHPRLYRHSTTDSEGFWYSVFCFLPTGSVLLADAYPPTIFLGASHAVAAFCYQVVSVLSHPVSGSTLGLFSSWVAICLPFYPFLPHHCSHFHLSSPNMVGTPNGASSLV